MVIGRAPVASTLGARMRPALLALALWLPSQAGAEIAYVEYDCGESKPCTHYMPRLANIPGWHRSTERLTPVLNGLNLQVPDDIASQGPISIAASASLKA